MSSKRNKIVLRYTNLAVNVTWYLLNTVAVVSVVLFIVLQLFDSFTANYKITIPVSPSVVILETPLNSSLVEIESAKASLTSAFLLKTSPKLYYWLIFFLCFAFVIVLYGVYLVRMILKSATNDLIFDIKNIRRLKILALLIFSYVPLGWIAHIFVFSLVSELITPNTGFINFDFNFGVIITGMLIYSLAAVFEKGYELYQEQKLTV